MCFEDSNMSLDGAKMCFGSGNMSLEGGKMSLDGGKILWRVVRCL